jgi:hypothetical protein
MPESWHDINDPGYFFKPQPEPADNTRIACKTDSAPEPKQPAQTEVRLSGGKFVPPDAGLKFNDKCKIQVKVEYLLETSLKRIMFSLFCNYNGATEQMKPDKEGFEEDGIAEAEFTLYYPEGYRHGDTAEYFFKASHRRGERVVESGKLTLPMASEKDDFRPVEIFSATESGAVDQNLRISIKGENGNAKYKYKEEDIELTASTQLPRNKKITIHVPQSETKPVFTICPDTGNSKNAFDLPLQSFFAKDSTDPVKIFMYNYASTGSSPKPVMKLDGDTSYLNGIQFAPVTDEEAPLLFVQEMKSPLNILDDEVIIENLTGKDCESIVKEILGHDFEDQLDRKKVEEGERETFWTRGEVGATASTTAHDFYLERHILRDFGFRGRFYIKTTKGKQYIIFRGYKGLRKWYTGTRYQVTNPKVIDLTVKGALKSGLKGNGATIFIVGAVDILDWMFDEKNEKHLSDLCVTLAMDSLKVVISNIIAAGLAASFIFLVGGVLSFPLVCVVVVGTIAIGVAVALGMDFIDLKIGASEYLKTQSQEGESFLKEAWQEIVVEPFGNMYYQLEKTIENLYYYPVGSGF